MNQREAVLALLKTGPKSTNDLIRSSYHIAAEYRRAISELRRRGYVITYHKDRGGSGLYTLDAEPPMPVACGLEPTGQRLLFEPGSRA